jgi:hypothetical protein
VYGLDAQDAKEEAIRGNGTCIDKLLLTTEYEVTACEEEESDDGEIDDD